MNKFAFSSFEDADILLFVTDIFEKYNGTEPVINALSHATVPKYLIINKIDLDKDNKADEVATEWESRIVFNETFFISAEKKQNTDVLLQKILDDLPENPPFYPKDDLSDKPERFFVSEIIRENILTQYKQEVPYSCEVVVTRFKEEEKKRRSIIDDLGRYLCRSEVPKTYHHRQSWRSHKKTGYSLKTWHRKLFRQAYLS